MSNNASSTVVPRRRRFSSSRSSSSSNDSSLCDDDDDDAENGQPVDGLYSTRRPRLASGKEATRRQLQIERTVLQEDMCRATILSLEARLCSRYRRVLQLLLVEVSREADEQQMLPLGPCSSNDFLPHDAVEYTLEAVPGDLAHRTGAGPPIQPPLRGAEEVEEKPDAIDGSPLNGDGTAVVLRLQPQQYETSCGISEDEDEVSPREPQRDVGVVRLRASQYGAHADEPQEQESGDDGFGGGTNSTRPTLSGDPLLHRAWCELNATHSSVASPQRRLPLATTPSTVLRRSQGTGNVVTHPPGRAPHGPSKSVAATERFLRRHPSSSGPVTPLPEAYRTLSTREADALYFSCVKVPESFDQRQRREAAERLEEAQRTSRQIEVERQARANVQRDQHGARVACAEAAADARARTSAACDDAWWSLLENHLDGLSVLLHGLSSFSMMASFREPRDSMPWETTGRVMSTRTTHNASATEQCVQKEAWVREAIVLRLQGLLWLHLTQVHTTSALAIRRSCQQRLLAPPANDGHRTNPITREQCDDPQYISPSPWTPRRSIRGVMSEALATLSPSPPRLSHGGAGIRRGERVVFSIQPRGRIEGVGDDAPMPFTGGPTGGGRRPPSSVEQPAHLPEPCCTEKSGTAVVQPPATSGLFFLPTIKHSMGSPTAK